MPKDDPQTGAPRQTDHYPEREPEREQEKNPSGQDEPDKGYQNEAPARPSGVSDVEAPPNNEPGPQD